MRLPIATCSSHDCIQVAAFTEPYGRGWCLRHHQEYELLTLGKLLNYPRMEIDTLHDFTIYRDYYRWFRWCRDEAPLPQHKLRISQAIAFAQKLLSQV